MPCSIIILHIDGLGKPQAPMHAGVTARGGPLGLTGQSWVRLLCEARLRAISA
jgi:hypothetical protein